jgi:DNA-3-methyladenine glycosylase II
LRRNPENSIDVWDGSSYQRLLTVDNNNAEIAVTQRGLPEKPVLHVKASVPGGSIAVKRIIASRIRMMLGTDIDLSGFYNVARGNKSLMQLAAQFSGLKPPRFASLYEAVVNGICYQQLSLAAGTALLNRLAGFGPVHNGRRAFPRPGDLADLKADELKKLGFSTNKAIALVALSRSIIYEGLDLESLGLLSDEEVIEKLDAIRGVGPWTAAYVLLRGMGRLWIFPGKDVGASRNLNRYFGFKKTLDDSGIRNFLSRFHPYEGMVYFHLLLKNLTERGII